MWYLQNKCANYKETLMTMVGVQHSASFPDPVQLILVFTKHCLKQPDRLFTLNIPFPWKISFCAETRNDLLQHCLHQKKTCKTPGIFVALFFSNKISKERNVRNEVFQQCICFLSHENHMLTKGFPICSIHLK